MVYYIQETEKENLFRKIFCIIKSKDKKIEIPVKVFRFYEENTKSRLQNFYINRLIKKLKKSIKENPIVISKSIKENINFIEKLEKNNINIFDGKWLYRYILIELVENILKQKKQEKETTEISFLVNYIDDVVIENIKIFAKIFKRVNIITNHIEKFKKIEEELYENQGIIITVSNNKKRSLLKSNFIINLDFPNELINKFNICENAVIISIEELIKINRKRFSGIIIKDYEINLKEELDLVEEYSCKEIFESLIYRKDNFYNIRKDIEDNKVEVKELIGRNGKIC